MPRKRRSPHTAQIRRRVDPFEVPVVSTDQPSQQPKLDDALKVATEQEDAAETVRRMVEAAYT